MKNLRIALLALGTIISLFSMKDKATVTSVPDVKPALVAEAYHSPQSVLPESLTIPSSISLPSSTKIQPQMSGKSPSYGPDSSDLLSRDVAEESSGGFAPQSTLTPKIGESAIAPQMATRSSSSDSTVVAPGTTVVYGLGGSDTSSSGSDDGSGSGSDSGSGSGSDNGTPKSQSQPNPVISGLEPVNGITGTTVIIQGAGFSSTASNNIVKFGSASSAGVSYVSGNQIRAQVPQGMANGFSNVSVTIGDVASKTLPFCVLRKNSGANVFLDNIQNILPAGFNPSDSSIVRLADVENDNDLDLFIVDTIAASVYLLVNNGQGAFADGTSAKLPAITNPGLLTDACFADVNNDGYKDLVIIYSSGQPIRLFLNNGQGVFSDATVTNLPAISGNAASIDAGDSNGDGAIDIVIAFRDSKDKLLANNGNGIFNIDTNFDLPALTDSSSDIRFCDVDGDGDLDIITTNNDTVDSSSLRTRVYINDGQGQYTDNTETILPEDSEYNEVLDCGDIDLDGDIDMIIANNHQNILLFNNANGTFTDGTNQHLPINDFASRDIKFGDINGDGYLDIEILGETGLSLLVNDGQGIFKDDSIKFPDYRTTPAVIGGKNVQLADINGDGCLDTIVGGGSFHILLSMPENKAPVLDRIGNKTVAVGETLTFNISGSDPNGDALTFLAQSLPGSATFTSLTKVFNWIPQASDIGEHKNIRFIAKEENTADQLEASEDITITVTGVAPELPIIDYIIPDTPDLDLLLGQLTQFGISAHDPHNEPLTFKWFLNGIEIPTTSGASSSMIFIVPRLGENVVEVQVSNSSGGVGHIWNVTASTTANYPPTCGFSPGTEHIDIDLNSGGGWNFSVTAIDGDNDTLTYEWLFDNSSVPSHSEDGTTSTATIATLTVGIHTLTVAVSDGHNPAVSHTWTLDVTDSTPPVNNPPLITNPQPAQSDIYIDLATGGGIGFGITASDPDSDALTYIWKFDGNTVSSSPGLSSSAYAAYMTVGNHTIEVSVTDNKSAPVTHAWILHIIQTTINNPPAITAHSPVQLDISVDLEIDQLPNFSITAQDADSDALFYTWKIDNNIVSDSGGLNSTAYSTYATIGTHIVEALVTDNKSDPVTRQWVLHITQSTGNHPPVIETYVPAAETVTLAFGGTQDFSITASDQDTGDVLTYQWYVNDVPVGSNSNSYTYTGTEAGQFTIKVTVNDGNVVTPPEHTWLVTVNMQDVQQILNDIMNTSFNYFWNQTGSAQGGSSMKVKAMAESTSASTGLVRDRVLVNGDPATDLYYDRASIAATGFGLATLCVAAEKYGTAPEWDKTPEELAARAEAILTTIANIQDNQKLPGGAVDWGVNGFLYHFVKMDSVDYGKSYTNSEVSSIDTAILVAGALTAGEYFKTINPNVSTLANQIYTNIDWHSFVDYTSVDNYGQIYKQWKPDGTGYSGHYDYNDESLLIYLLAIGSPDSGHAIEKDLYYSARRELGSYGVNGKPIVQTWFGSLFAYQYVHAFFDLSNMHDARNIDWWQNSVEATKSNRQFALDQDASYGYNQYVWGISSSYDEGSDYHGNFGTLPLRNPPGPFHDGTINPNVVASAIGMLPVEAGDTLTFLKTDPNLWKGDQYGFVGSFKNSDPKLYSVYFVGIDLGAATIMSANYTDSGIIWNNFMNAAGGYGTMRDLLSELNFKPNSDTKFYVDVDDISPKSQFAYGLIDADNPSFQISFNLTSVVPNSKYMLAIHTFMNNYKGNYDASINVNVNGNNQGVATFSHKTDQVDYDKYIEIDSSNLQTGENIITFNWQDGSSWVAWKNIEISSPVVNNTWDIATSMAANEYRLDDTYYTGHFNVYGINAYKTFEKALNRASDANEPSTDILFYVDDLGHNRKLTLAPNSSDGTVFINVGVVGATEILWQQDVVLSGQQIITIPADRLKSGWNVIRLTITPTGGTWVIWNSLKMELGDAVQVTAPDGLVSASLGPNIIKLRWNGVAGSNIRYNIYRSLTPGGAYSKLNTVEVTDTQYQDNGLSNNTTYYYVVTAYESADPANESNYSVSTSSTTGDWVLDYGDGKDPNAFGGANGSNILYQNTSVPGGANQYVRQVTLNNSNTFIGLSAINVDQATKLTMSIKGESGNEVFKIGVKDTLGHISYVDFSNPSTTWTPVDIDLNTLTGVTLTSLDQIVVSSTGSAVIYLYDIRFKTAAPSSTILTVKPLNISDQTVSTGVHFSSLDFNQTSVYKLSDQVIKVEYNPPNTGDNAAIWKMRIYTNNSDADMQAMPYQRNGLLNESKKCVVPVKWRAYDSLQGAVQFTDANAGSWIYLKDKNDLDIPGTPYDESWAGANISGQEYTVVAFGSNNTWEKWSRLADTTTCDSPVYVYVGAIFKGDFGGQNFMAARGEYSTTIYFELYNE